MSQFRMNEVTSEQRARACALAKQEVGVGNVPNDQLTPMALFLMSAISDQCVGIAVRESKPASQPERTTAGGIFDLVEP